MAGQDEDTLTVGVAEGASQADLGGLAGHFDPATEATDVVLVGGAVTGVRAVAEAETRPIVAVAAQVDRRQVTALLDAGAGAVVAADDPPAAVRAVAAAVHAGYVVVPAPLRHVVRRPVLTARQKQILSLLVLGLRNQDIAERLILSEATVKTHLTAIFQQLGVRTRAEAVDLILDPASGLGTGILGIGDQRGVQVGYGAPRVGDG